MLREHKAGSPTDEVCRRHGISQQTFYRWKAKYGGMGVSDAPEVEDVRGREPAAEEAPGGVHAQWYPPAEYLGDAGVGWPAASMR